VTRETEWPAEVRFPVGVVGDPRDTIFGLDSVSPLPLALNFAWISI
jgi:hypothetical protein